MSCKARDVNHMATQVEFYILLDLCSTTEPFDLHIFKKKSNHNYIKRFNLQ